MDLEGWIAVLYAGMMIPVTIFLAGTSGTGREGVQEDARARPCIRKERCLLT